MKCLDEIGVMIFINCLLKAPLADNPVSGCYDELAVEMDVSTHVHDSE